MKKTAALFGTLSRIHILSKKSIALMFVIPAVVVVIMLLTQAMYGGSSLKVSFQDNDNTKSSESLRDMLKSTQRVIFSADDEIEQAGISIIVPRGFERSLLNKNGMRVIIAGDSELAMGEYIRSLLEYRIDNIAKVAWFADGDAAVLYEMLSDMPRNIETVHVPDVLHKGEVKLRFLALLNIFVLLGSAGLSMVLIEGVNKGMYHRFKAIGIGSGGVIMSLSGVFMLIGLFQTAVAVLMTLALNVSGITDMSIIAVAFVMIVSNILLIILGVFAGSAAKNLQSAVFIIALLVLPVSMISGGLFPFSFSSSLINVVISWLPPRYLLDAAAAISEGSFGSGLLLKGAVLLFACAGVMLCCVKMLRRKIEA